MCGVGPLGELEERLVITNLILGRVRSAGKKVKQSEKLMGGLSGLEALVKLENRKSLITRSKLERSTALEG